jgi:hypothetical protein
MHKFIIFLVSSFFSLLILLPIAFYLETINFNDIYIEMIVIIFFILLSIIIYNKINKLIIKHNL